MTTIRIPINAQTTYDKTVKGERTIAILVLFKTRLSRFNGTTIKLTPDQIHDVINRMYRRIYKSLTKCSQTNKDRSMAFIPSISGYSSTKNQPYAYVNLGVPRHYRKREFVDMVNNILQQCPFIERCIINPKGKMLR